jgi:glyoxylase-like metal-dependent hydrolase (beta-lactamase superfamily II)
MKDADIVAAPKLRTKPAGWYRFSIGDFEATIVSDGHLTLRSATDEFPRAPKEEVRRLFDAEFMQADPMVLQQNALVVNTGRRLVLFDTGMGEGAMFGTRSGRLLANLAAAGIDPGDIDAVALTHPHPDHAWGLIGAGGVRRFPNAEVFVSKVDHDFWTDEGKIAKSAENGIPPLVITGARDSLFAYRDRLSFVEDGMQIVAGVTALSTPGHTLGHTSHLISSNGQNVLNLGDICHQHVLLAPNPRWEFDGDTDAGLAVESRLRIFERAVDEELTLVGFHFPYPGIGRLARGGSGYRYVAAPMDLV